MSASSNERVWIGGGAVSALLVAGLAWMFVINPELSSANSLNGQTSSAQTQNDVLRAKITKLRRDNSKLPALTEQLTRARAGLPATSGMTDFTRQLTTEAAAHHLTLGALTIGNAKVVGPGGAGLSSGTGGGSTALDTIPVTITATGAAADLQSFLQEVQYAGARRVLLTSMQLAAPPASAQVAPISTARSATIQLSVFVAPQSAAAEAQLRKQLAAGTGAG